MNRSLQVSLWAVMALLTACGGGGGSEGGAAPAPNPAPGPTPPPPPPPNGATNANMAWRNFLTGSTTHAWSVTGTASDGKSYTVTLSTAAGPTEVFSMTGNSYASGDATGAIGISGLALNTSVSRSYYDPVTFQVVGTRTTINAQAPSCSIATALAAPPNAANVGQSGALNTFNDYSGCTPSTASKTGTSVTTWSLETDGGFTFLCLNTTTKNNADQVTGTESDCVEANTDGSLGTHARVTVTGGLDLVAKNY